MSDLTFRSEPPPDDDGAQEPVPFDLVVWRRKKDAPAVEESHTFTCIPRSEVSGHHVTRVALSGARGGIAAAAEEWHFLELVMEPDDLRRLDALLADTDVYVDRLLLIKAAQGLFQEYAGRPTVPQQNSNGGRSQRGRTSAARRG